jgi:hypothetical protein
VLPPDYSRILAGGVHALREIAPYFGLAPGWRVLLAPGYVDVWYDRTLLDV